MKKSYSSIITLFLLALHPFIQAQNYVTTYAGDGVSGFVNGDTAVARFKAPFGICIDKNENLFLADQDNHCIRMITPNGIVSTYAGTGIAGYVDGPGSSAQFNSPIDVCADVAGNIYVSDFGNQYIRKISIGGMVTTVAGNGIAGYADGPSASAEFNYPRGICIDLSGNLYIGDSWNHRIRKIDAGGEVSTYAGGGNSFGVQSVGDYLDGNDTSARFYTPCGLTIDNAGNIYVADAYNHRVRMIDLSRVVTTVAGSGSSGPTTGGFADGNADTARFNTLTELMVTAGGKIFIGDTYNHRIRLVNNGVVSTVAGNGGTGLVNGVDSLAKFNRPRGVVPDSSGNHVYVCDNLNYEIRKITLGVETGITQNSVAKDLMVFPNPSSGTLFFEGNLLFTQVVVQDIWGREIFSEHVSPFQPEINLENLLPGIYLLSFYLGDFPLQTIQVVIHH